MKQIGIYGGAFNPIHNQHLINATNALETLQLDEIWFVPTKTHPVKGEVRQVSDGHRLEMLRLATAFSPQFIINTFEIESVEINYTSRTLMAFRTQFPEVQFTLIIGGDNLENFHTWHHAVWLLEHVNLFCYPRLDATNKWHPSLNPFSHKITIYNGVQSTLSSSHLRDIISQKKSIRHYVPEAVFNYIMAHHLYF